MGWAIAEFLSSLKLRIPLWLPSLLQMTDETRWVAFIASLMSAMVSFGCCTQDSHTSTWVSSNVLESRTKILAVWRWGEVDTVATRITFSSEMIWRHRIWSLLDRLTSSKIGIFCLHSLVNLRKVQKNSSRFNIQFYYFTFSVRVTQLDIKILVEI